MKKVSLKVLTVLICGSMLASSCLGSFALFNKTLDWNKQITGSKFVNNLIYWCLYIIPVYEIIGVVDALVLNTIEFWTGNNPSGKVGEVKNVWGKDGKQYAVKTLKNGYEVKKPTGEIVNFFYDNDTKAWSVEKDGQQIEMFRFNEDNQSVQANIGNGRTMNVTLDEAGIYALRAAFTGNSFFALR